MLCAQLLCGNEFRIVTLEYNPGLGMFASANQVIGQIYQFETGQLPNVTGLAIDFGENGLFYDSNYGSNWWTYYFEPITLGTHENASLYYPTREQYADAWYQRKLLPKVIAAEIVKKYVHIKPHIQEKIDAIVDRYFAGHHTIGVHYRGTDKFTEAPRINYEIVFEEIDKHIPEEKFYIIFVATDEVDFLKAAQERYSDRVVAIEAHRSEGGNEGIHFANKHNYLLGEEALLDACLLSKCDLLIRTSSSLSLWSTYFNPTLPVVLLTQRYMPTLEPE